MIIQMLKFNNVLNGRPTAREDFLRIVQIVNGSMEKENIILDFSGVEILTPSYADELLQELKEKYGNDKIKITNISNIANEVVEAVSK